LRRVGIGEDLNDGITEVGSRNRVESAIPRVEALVTFRLQKVVAGNVEFEFLRAVATSKEISYEVEFLCRIRRVAVEEQTNQINNSSVRARALRHTGRAGERTQ